MGGEATERICGVRTDRVRALEFLRKATGRSDAEFRDGQWEAIEGIMRNRRQLVVQRTGWGKSMIYFLAAKFLREEGRGMTLLISPLLALMRNQVAAARRIGLRCDTINCNCTKAENDKTMQLALAAAVWLSKAHVQIAPRKRWADTATAGAAFGAVNSVIPAELMLEPGIALAAYGCGQWGRMVAQCKYRTAPPRFDDRLVEACVEMFRGWRREKNPVWVACVPSLRHPELVQDFARRFALAAGMEFSPCVVKVRETEEQKRQANSYMQQNNVISAFAVRGETPKGDCLLIDDMADSRWTLTVVGALLRKAGAASVTPMVLADSSNSGE